jgi:hypothetical protein
MEINKRHNVSLYREIALSKKKKKERQKELHQQNKSLGNRIDVLLQ